jgi:hypothetical protein
MEQERFWALIEQARTDAGGELGEDGGLLATALTKRLAELPAADIAAFATRYAALMAQADSPQLWGAAYLIGGGCTVDAFVDFRVGLVACGQDWHQRAIADPDSLASHPAVSEAAEWDDDSAIFAELVHYAAGHAYEQVTGDPLAVSVAAAHELSRPWDFDDDDEMRRRLPRLSALFLGWPENEGCKC